MGRGGHLEIIPAPFPPWPPLMIGWDPEPSVHQEELPGRTPKSGADLGPTHEPEPEFGVPQGARNYWVLALKPQCGCGGGKDVDLTMAGSMPSGQPACASQLLPTRCLGMSLLSSYEGLRQEIQRLAQESRGAAAGWCSSLIQRTRS